MTRGCTGSGVLDDSDFSKPLPTIGFYVAAASFCCAAGMGADAFLGLRSRRFWFPNKYFTLNAATLTILAVATKLPVDLNTSMPSAVDQLSKLSSTILICTVMGNFIPSLGVMDNPISNILALAILSLTVIVNVGIQMGTGVIYVYRHEHIVIIIFTLLLLILLISSALPISTRKDELEEVYDEKHVKLKEDGYDERKLRDCVEAYWLMAHTSSPQYVLGRSATCTASGAFCLLSAFVLLQAVIRLFLGGHSRFCKGTSDYGSSVYIVLFSQAFAIAVGTVAPASRWFSAVNYLTPSPGIGCGTWNDVFTVEEYWVQKLTELKEAPLNFRIIKNWQIQKIIQSSKNQVLGLLIKAQCGIVSASKVVRHVSIMLVSHGRKPFQTSVQTPSCPTGSLNLEEFVLRLEREDGLVALNTWRRHIERWIEKGKKRSPKYLESLLKLDRIRQESRQAFIWVGCIDCEEVRCLSPDLEGKDPESCWALPIVILATISAALPGVSRNSLETLLMGVDEGLVYVRKIEHYLEAKGLRKQREAAEIIWSRLRLHNQWFDLNLRGETPQSSRDVIKKFVEKEEKEFLDKHGTDKTQHDNLSWPPRVQAAFRMYRVGSTIQRHWDKNPVMEDHLFCWLREAISHVLRACLTNLPKALLTECYGTSIEVREQRVRSAALMLGEAEAIMSKLDEAGAASGYPSNRRYLDSWRESQRGILRESGSSISEWLCEDCPRDEMPRSAYSTTTLLCVSCCGGTEDSVISNSEVRLPHDQDPEVSLV